MIIKEIQADARHVVVLYEAAQFRDSQTVARGQYLGSDTFEIKINKYIYTYILTVSLAKPRQNAEAFFRSYELIIYGDMYCITNSFYKYALKIAIPYTIY
jgi:hypothetical protein